MKKRDLILIFAVVAVSCALMLFFNFPKDTDTIKINVDGEFFGEYPLSENREININGTNTVKIENGEAYMLSATCPDKLCMHQGKIGKTGKSIICLPNRVSLESSSSQIDAISR
ncbi:MAG: NusG domain II-containing protein [Clostridia bacterium]|nr:NusG domain II-containing protein [Clostridia bacterium]